MTDFPAVSEPMSRQSVDRNKMITGGKDAALVVSALQLRTQESRGGKGGRIIIWMCSNDPKSLPNGAVCFPPPIRGKGELRYMCSFGS